MRTIKFVWMLPLVVGLSSCVGGGKSSSHTSSSSTSYQTEGSRYLSYEASTLDSESLKAYTGTDIKNSDGSWNNQAHENGIVNSPYWKLKLNGKEVGVYGTRTTDGLHSFAYILVTDKFLSSYNFELSSTDGSTITSSYVLPSFLNVAVDCQNESSVSFSLANEGQYTFINNRDYTKAITIFIYDAEDLATPEGYSETKMEAGDNGFISIDTAKTVLRFASGIHYVDTIRVTEDDCKIIFEEGAILVAKQPSESESHTVDWANQNSYATFLAAYRIKNLEIKGPGFIDYTKLDWHARSGASFQKCEGLSIKGVIFNNSPEWTLTISGCINSSITNTVIFGYRQNSDGYAICDCNNVTVSKCFARSGDDLFEVKTLTTTGTSDVANITFSDCVAWADKCRGCGFIYENNRAATGLTWKNIGIIKAPGTFMDELGALVVIVYGAYDVKDVLFENIEINDCDFYPINVSLLSKKKGNISNVTFRNISIPNNKNIRLRNDATQGTVTDIHFENITRDGNKITDVGGMRFKTTGTIGNVYLDNTLLNLG